MTKSELLREYNALCGGKQMRIDGVSGNSNKAEIENAIACLKCPDETLADYATVVRLKYPNTWAAIQMASLK